MSDAIAADGCKVAANRMSFGRWMREIGWRHVIVWLGLAFALYPVVWIVSAAFNKVQSLVAARLIPREMTTRQLHDALRQSDGAVPALDHQLLQGGPRRGRAQCSAGGGRCLRLQPTPLQGSADSGC